MNAAYALAAELLDAVIARLESDPASVKRLRAIVTGSDATYSQDERPPRMTRRAYMDHCARRDWPSRKQGRLRVSMRSDVDAWLAARGVAARTIAAPPGIVDPDAYLLALGARPAKKRGR